MTVVFTAGTRIRLLSTSDEYTQLQPGDEGTVCRMRTTVVLDDADIMDVHWDSGSNLSLIMGVDEFEVIPS